MTKSRPCSGLRASAATASTSWPAQPGAARTRPRGAQSAPELQDVAVRAAHRRLGIASALTQAAEAEAAARGFDRLRVTVSNANPAAQGLYRKQGYRDTGIPPKRVRGTIIIRTGPIEVDDTILTWEKRLDGPRN